MSASWPDRAGLTLGIMYALARDGWEPSAWRSQDFPAECRRDLRLLQALGLVEQFEAEASTGPAGTVKRWRLTAAGRNEGAAYHAKMLRYRPELAVFDADRYATREQWAAGKGRRIIRSRQEQWAAVFAMCAKATIVGDERYWAGVYEDMMLDREIKHERGKF